MNGFSNDNSFVNNNSFFLLKKLKIKYLNFPIELLYN